MKNRPIQLIDFLSSLNEAVIVNLISLDSLMNSQNLESTKGLESNVSKEVLINYLDFLANKFSRN